MPTKKTMKQYAGDKTKKTSVPVIDWERAKPVMPESGPKPQITIKVSAHTLAWFKKQGKGYQSRMNAVLDAYVLEMEKHD